MLQTQLVLPKIIAMRGSPALRLGESVVAFGFPLTGSLSMEGNLTTGNVSALAGLARRSQILQITAPVQPGNSGGPLLDESGNLIGVITAKLDAMAIAKRTGDIPQNVNFAIKTEVVEAFLKSAGVRYEKSVSDRPLQVADIADIAKASAVRIECSPSAGADRGPTRVMPPVERTSPHLRSRCAKVLRRFHRTLNTSNCCNKSRSSRYARPILPQRQHCGRSPSSMGPRTASTG